MQQSQEPRAVTAQQQQELKQTLREAFARNDGVKCWAWVIFDHEVTVSATNEAASERGELNAGEVHATPPSPPGGTEARRHQEPILLTPACSAAMVGGTRGCIRATSSGQSLLRCSAASPRRSTRLIDPTERRQSPPLPGTGDLRGSPAGRCELPRDDDPMSAAGSGAQQTSCRCASSY